LIDAAGKVAHVWKKVNVDGRDEAVIATIKEPEQTLARRLPRGAGAVPILQS